jgi:hypothetical protein
MREIKFTNEHAGSGAGKIVDILRKPRLWIPTAENYSDFSDWLEKTEAQVSTDEKRAMLATVGTMPVGTVVYRRHESDPETLEIRNISVMPAVNGRLFGSFMLRQVEIEGAVDYPGVNRIIVDTKISNSQMLSFLMSNSYSMESVEDLYGLGTGKDAILTKTLT